MCEFNKFISVYILLYVMRYVFICNILTCHINNISYAIDLMEGEAVIVETFVCLL